MRIGIILFVSFQAIKINEWSSIKKEIKIPFNTAGNCKVEVDIIRPATTHRQNAEILASHVSFCSIMGITSIIPAIHPNNIPSIMLFIQENRPVKTGRYIIF